MLVKSLAKDLGRLDMMFGKNKRKTSWMNHQAQICIQFHSKGDERTCIRAVEALNLWGHC